MSRISFPQTIDAAPAAAQETLKGLQAKLGMAPNLYKLLSLTPAGLEGALSLSGALAKTSLEPHLRERIALAVANVNGCDYCNAAHTAIGKSLKLSETDITAARAGHAADAKADAAVAFARKVTVNRAQVSEADIKAVSAAGFTDAQIVEIVLVVAANVLTNYVNEVFKTPVDFPATTPATRVA
ncbi:MAG TPA: alkylhydroperoxidase [Alphaproteobacteria bacterium]|nr:alkylhydroperoxidase [Alphaproteobacteria bacterium]HAJ47258.1 alkylhydroperoxidase [Alphaproteobacteria bacterium]